MRYTNISAGLILTLCITHPASAAQKKTLAQWEQCAKQTITAVARRGETLGSDGGNGYIWGACGPKPSMKTLPCDEREVLQKACQDQNFTDLPHYIMRWFYPYGEHSPHWNMAAKECNRIHHRAVTYQGIHQRN